MLLAALLPLALATPLAEPGERLAGCEVLDVVEHPEFQRVQVALEDGRRLLVEATAKPGGACTHHGVTLFPRWELLGEQREAEDQPPVVVALCERLEERGEALLLRPPLGEAPPKVRESRPGEGPDGAPSAGTWTIPGPSSPGPSFGLLHGVLLAWLVCVLAVVVGPARRAWRKLGPSDRRELVAVGLIGLLARAALSPRVVFWGPFFGYGRLTEAWGTDLTHPLYGGGFAALMGPLSAAFGYSPDVVFFTHLAMASLAPPLLWALTRLLLPRARLGPLIAGLGLALLPSHLRMSATEAMHVDVTTFELLSVTAAVAFTHDELKEGALGRLALACLSALSVGFACHIRPEALPAVLVPVGWVLMTAQRRHLPGVLLAALVIMGLVGLRAVEVVLSTGRTAVNYGNALSWDFVRDALLPSPRAPGATSFTNTFLNLRMTSPLLPALGVAAFALRGYRRLAAFALAWWALAALPVLPKSWPLADALRLQLPAQPAALLLAGLGAQALALRWPRLLEGNLRKALPVGLIALCLPYLPQVTTLWAPHVEHLFLRAQAPELPEGATVLYDDAGPHHDAFGRWMSFASPQATWRGMSQLSDALAEEREGPLMVWLGTSCFLTRPPQGMDDYGPLPSACPDLQAACTLTPWRSVTAPRRSDVDVWLEEPPTLGFYVVEACPGSPRG